MNVERLYELGFKKNEAKVFLSLSKFQNATAGQIISDTKIHRKIVYDELSRLVDKGLVVFMEEEGSRVYSLSSPDALMLMFEEKVNDAEKLKKKAEGIKRTQVIL